MIDTAMETSYQKIEPKVINYRNYKSFSNEGFRESLHENSKEKLWEKSDKSFSNFIVTSNTVIEKQRPKNENYIKGHQLSFYE